MFIIFHGELTFHRIPTENEKNLLTNFMHHGADAEYKFGTNSHGTPYMDIANVERNIEPDDLTNLNRQINAIIQDIHLEYSGDYGYGRIICLNGNITEENPVYLSDINDNTLLTEVERRNLIPNEDIRTQTSKWIDTFDNIPGLFIKLLYNFTSPSDIQTGFRLEQEFTENKPTYVLDKEWYHLKDSFNLSDKTLTELFDRCGLLWFNHTALGLFFTPEQTGCDKMETNWIPLYKEIQNIINTEK